LVYLLKGSTDLQEFIFYAGDTDLKIKHNYITVEHKIPSEAHFTNYSGIHTGIWEKRRLSHVRWVLFHHSMGRSQVADGEEGLQIWMVTAKIMNKQSRTADKGWSSSLWVGHGTNNP
jgi:hypothetical protein